MRRKLICIIILIVFFSEICLANENVTQTGRYLTISNKPKISQVDLLAQTMQLHFARNTETIGDAVIQLLKFSGYSLVPVTQMSQELQIILHKPLPLVDRDMGPMSLKDSLTTLIGSAFYMVDDPVNRVINFKLKPEYQKFIKHKKT